MRISWQNASSTFSTIPWMLCLVGQLIRPVYAQGETVPLNQITAFSISSATRSMTISLPRTSQPVILSVEVCTQIDGQPAPKFFVLNASTSSTTSRITSSTTQSATTGLPIPNADGEEIQLLSGLGVWKSFETFTNGGTLTVQTTATFGTWSFSVGVSDRSAYTDHALLKQP